MSWSLPKHSSFGARVERTSPDRVAARLDCVHSSVTACLTVFCRASTSGKGEGDDSQQASMRAAQLISSIKRRKSHRALAALAHGPGGGAMEGPPLLHRDHHSVHGGMEYYKCAAPSLQP